PGFADAIIPTLTGNDVLPERQLLELFVSNLQQVGDELYVIMDDLHHLDGCGFAGLIEAALNDIPSHVHFVVSTRFKVGMFCAKSVSNSNSCWFNVDDLRFSQDEVHQYYRDIKSIQASDADI